MLKENLKKAVCMVSKTNFSGHHSIRTSLQIGYDLIRAQNVTRGKGGKGFEDYTATIRFP